MIHPGVALDAVIGANIRHRREDAGLTGPQLAARVGIGAGRLAEIERGLFRPTSPEMTALQRALGCGLAEIFDEPRPERLLS